MDLYFQRHDGQAVTCDDFAQAIADANPGSAWPTTLDAFKRWYSQAGTPRADARGHYDARSAHLHAAASSSTAQPTPGQTDEAAVRDPGGRRRCSARDGRALPLQLEDEPTAGGHRARAGARRGEAASSPSSTSTSEPVPSLLRGFSAPVHPGRRRWPTPTCWCCCSTTATPSTAGRPASAWRCNRLLGGAARGDARRCSSTRRTLEAHARRAAPPAARRRRSRRWC